jgi:cellulose synthase/poly-beta-1,6-N-acetylglucosamine synthase-like glycosyltransferase
MIVLGAAFLILTLLLGVFFSYLFTIAISSLRDPARRPGPANDPTPAPRFLIVIPAHDEERTIRRTAESCMAVDYDRSRFRVIVVADNCSDSTAEVARGVGAEVIERTDTSLRGKGYALDFFFQSFPAHEPDCGYDAVVVIDADTVVDPKMLTVFSHSLAAGRDWMQCYNTVRNSDDSLRTRLLTFALSLMNGVWLVGQEGLKMSVSLRGNGMCFSSRGLRRHPWRAFGLVEDRQFSWSLRLARERVWFEPETFVLSEMVTQYGQAARSQCRRWHFGRTGLHAEFLGPVIRSKNLSVLEKALYSADLGFPPMLNLLLGFLATTLVHPLVWAYPGLETLSIALLPAHAFFLLALIIYALSPIFVMGLPARYLFSSMAAAPYYFAWKLFATLGRPPTSWVRTDRILSNEYKSNNKIVSDVINKIIS